MGVIVSSFKNLKRPNNLLQSWHCSVAMTQMKEARNLHQFGCQIPVHCNHSNQHYLFDTLSGLHFTVNPLLGILIHLSLLPEEEAEAYISDIAATATLPELFDAIENHSKLTRYLRQLATPLPAGDESDVQKCELMMYGNLECNLKCPYCNSLKARMKADRGEAPRLMPMETARQCVRFIAERTAGRAGQIYVNFSLGGERLREICVKGGLPET